MDLSKADLKEFLEEKYLQYNTPSFIEFDPISIPHQFEKREDIEIAGFLAATIAWGNRKSIIKNANRLVELMDNDPHEFILNVSASELGRFSEFVHRTFNGLDCMFFLKSLQNIYTKHNGIGAIFEKYRDVSISQALIEFRRAFFEIDHLPRTEKHVSNIEKGAAAKRLNMYLRWMIRNDNRGVDFGLWDIPSSKLLMPLDVHTGNVGRMLGLLKRNANDWKSVLELTIALREFDYEDPVKYDFALFGLGVFENF